MFLILAIRAIPRILGAPQVYNNWGNFFERFSLVIPALIVFASAFESKWARGVKRAGVLLFGICVVSFALEQAFYLSTTASLVPKWIPPGQMFWAVATTVAFALAGIAILSGFQALPASRLLTLMIVLFGVLVWFPIVIARPHSRTNWSETIETFAIAGAAWVVADLLKRRQTSLS